MFFDMNYDSPINGFSAMPDFPFATLYLQDPITDLIIIDNQDSYGSVNTLTIAGGEVNG